MGGIVDMIMGSKPKAPELPPAAVGPTAAELAAKDAQLAKDSAAAAGDKAMLESDRRRAAAGSATTLLTGTGILEDARIRKPGLSLKSTLGGGA